MRVALFLPCQPVFPDGQRKMVAIRRLLRLRSRLRYAPIWPAGPDRIQVLVVVWLIAAICLVFGQSLRFEFLNWDDNEFVVPHMQRFLGLTPEAVTWSFANRENGWRTPLPYLTLFADVELYGLSSAGMHLTNLLIHLASTVILFVTLQRMTKQSLPSLLAATLFAIHPLHVEPVAWVTGRWELLCGFFWIVGMWCYVRYCVSPTRLRFLAVAAAYCCALMSKPMALTFPFALLLLDYWPLHRLGRSNAGGRIPISARPFVQVLAEKIPLFLVMAFAVVISWLAKSEYLDSRGMIPFSLQAKLMNGIETYATYLVNTFWPTDLSFYYVHPALSGGFHPARTIGSALLLLSVTGAAVYWARQYRFLLVGWLWYLGVFVPAIGLLQVDHHARADRYTYLPLIGIFLAIGWGVTAFVSRWRPRHYAALAVVIGSLMAVAHSQTAHWRSSESLFRHGVQVDETNYKALTNLGNVLGRKGDFVKAREYYRRSLAVCPYDRSTINDLAVASYRCGDPATVCRLLSNWEMAPAAFPARYLLAICLAEEGHAQESVEVSRRMVAHDPQHAGCRAALAVGLESLGALAEAELEFRRALELDPSHSHCALRLSDLLARDGRTVAAADLLDRFTARNPRNVAVRNQLGRLRATLADKCPSKD